MTRTPAVLLAVPCTVTAYLFMSANPAPSDYAPARAAAVTATMIIVAPVLALAAAWEGMTLRELWGLLTVNRPWWRVLLGRLAVVVATGVVIQLLLYAVALADLPHSRWPGWQLPVLSLLNTATWTCFGAAVALVLGRLLALTIALLVPYLVLTLPAGWEPFWLRHVTGSPFDCCSTSEVLDPRVLVGSAGALGALLVISLCVARVRLAPAQHRPWLAAAVALGALVTGGAAVSTATGLGAAPTRQRPADSLVCRADVCLWPEDSAAFEANQVAWRAARDAWSRLGLPEPATNRIGPVAVAGILPLTTTGSSPETATVTMAQLMPRALARCLNDFEDPARNERLDRLSVLLLRELAPGPAEAATIVVPDPQPVPDDAPQLWRQAGSCAR